MILTVVKYGTPALRQKGARVETITPTIKKLIADLLETMYAHKGIGLAAPQGALLSQPFHFDTLPPPPLPLPPQSDYSATTRYALTGPSPRTRHHPTIP